MTGLKIVAAAAATESAVFVSGLDINLISKLGTVGILILAVVALWRSAGQRQDKLEGIIKEATTAITEMRDSNREVARVLEKCKAK